MDLHMCSALLIVPFVGGFPLFVKYSNRYDENR
jgi:hypothetical protein